MLGSSDRSITSCRIINAPEFTGIRFDSPEHPVGTVAIVACEVCRGRLWWKKYTLEYAIQCLSHTYTMDPSGNVDDYYVWKTLITFPSKSDARNFADAISARLAPTIEADGVL